MPTLTIQRTVSVPASVAWEVVSDHELYGELAPNLAAVEVIEGEGEGLRRRCVQPDGKAWTETTTNWEAGTSFGVEVDVGDSPVHRRLFSRMEGHWGVDEAPDGSRVLMRFEYDTRWGPLGRLVSAYFQRWGPPVLEPILDGWEDEMAARLEARGGPDAGDERAARPNRVYR